ncbi:MAG: hypothetical protein HQL96_15040 [Magnetococcales bacterium]|nr:hypothetical protein [Magnetococcales bacterium]
MMTDEELEALLTNLESDRVERKDDVVGFRCRQDPSGCLRHGHHGAFRNAWQDFATLTGRILDQARIS